MYNTWHTTSKDGDECVAHDDKGGVQWVSVIFQHARILCFLCCTLSGRS